MVEGLEGGPEGLMSRNLAFTIGVMHSDVNSLTNTLSGFLTSMWTQVRAGVVVGLPDVDRPSSVARPDERVRVAPPRRSIGSSGNYSGRLTGNGLGSLDIGGGRSGIDE